MIRFSVIFLLLVPTLEGNKHTAQKIPRECSRDHFYNTDLGRCTKCHFAVCFPGIPFGCQDTCVQNFASLFANGQWETRIKTYKEIQQKLEDIHGEIIRLVPQCLKTTGGESERLRNKNICDENCFKDLNFISGLALFILCVVLVLNVACLSIWIYSYCNKNMQEKEMLEYINKLVERLTSLKNEGVSPRITGQVDFQRQCSTRSSSSA